MQGILRQDGRKGIRHIVAVVYLVACAHHVSREIAWPYRERGARLIGFSGCYLNDYAQRMMERFCTHPNIGAVLLVSLGYESFNRTKLAQTIAQSGRDVKTLVIQESGGTRTTIDAGRQWIEQALAKLTHMPHITLDAATVNSLCSFNL